MLPKSLKNFNLFIEGEGYAGRVAEITLPKLSRKFEEFRGGGMNAPVELDQGMEKMETEFTLREFSRPVLAKYGLGTINGIGLRFRGAMLREDASNEVDTVEIVMRGRWREIDRGGIKSGDNAEMKVSGAIAYYKETVNGEAIMEIDPINMIEIVDGVDRLKEQREALGM